MKKLVSLILVGAMLFALAACSQKDEPSGKVKIISSIFPSYDFAREICRGVDGTQVSMLITPGTEPHSYEPSVRDMAAIKDCDLFIYLGGESDEWVDAVLDSFDTDEISTLKMLECVSPLEEEEVEGMQSDHDDEINASGENDEHVWLSLKNAEILVKKIAEAVANVDTAHAMEYHMNAALYIAKISALDAQYRAATDSAHFKTILFGDRFPFRYLVDDYGIKYFAAFVGCSAESEASFETVAFLAGKMDSLALPAIFTIDGSNGKIAPAVLAASKKSKETPVLTLNSMQSIKNSQMDSANYLDIMRENLEVIKKALK